MPIWPFAKYHLGHKQLVSFYPGIFTLNQYARGSWHSRSAALEDCCRYCQEWGGCWYCRWWWWVMSWLILIMNIMKLLITLLTQVVDPNLGVNDVLLTLIVQMNHWQMARSITTITTTTTLIINSTTLNSKFENIPNIFTLLLKIV